jgi:hypothetical protein
MLPGGSRECSGPVTFGALVGHAADLDVRRYLLKKAAVCSGKPTMGGTGIEPVTSCL